MRSVGVTSAPLAVSLNELLRRCQLELADTLQIDVLPSQPEIVVVLHGEPALGRTANGLGKAERHFGRDATRPLENAAKGRGRNIKLYRELAANEGAEQT